MGGLGNAYQVLGNPAFDSRIYLGIHSDPCGLMFTDLACIQACCDTYDRPSSFDKWFDGSTTDGVVCGLKFHEDSMLVAFRGSRVFLDWIRDFQAAMIHTDIGGVEFGFYTGMSTVLARILPLLARDKTIYLTGHSLGGGRGHVLAAMLINLGFRVEVAVFGSPRPGDKELAAILERFPNRAYKNGPDYVTDVPIPIHPLLPYVHPSPWIAVEAMPASNDDWGVLAWHHSELYLKALGA